MRRLLILALVALGALAAASPAGAAPTDPFQFKHFFDTSGISGGVEGATQMAVNHETGNVLVLERGRIDQFDAEGNPVDFSGTGSPTIENVGGQYLLIDNTGTATQGNIYVIDVQGCCGFAGERFWSYGPDGEPLGTNPHEEIGTSIMGFQGAWVAPDGQLWMIGFDWSTLSPHVMPVQPDGPPAGPMEPFTLNGGYYPMFQDELGHVYMPGSEGTFGRYDFTDNYTYEGETGLPTGAPTVLDPSTGDLYQRQNDKVVGIRYSDPLVKSSPFGVLSGITGGADAIVLDASGQTLYIAEGTRISIFHREPASAPRELGELGVDGIRSNRADLHGGLINGGAPTSFYFEYGPDTSYGSSTAPVSAPESHYRVRVDGSIEGLQPNTTYHVRMVAKNSAGTTYGPDKVIHTYPVPAAGADPCPNALARQQTGARSLPDCRAFELVSAKDTGGYDVESSVVPGQQPYPGFPEAVDKVLYSTHSGAIPGPWNPTNKGPDPYLATRTSEGWTTDYLGLPADIDPAAGSFSSAVGEASARLDSLAFAGLDLCSPCFDSGLETGIPVRRADGSLAQGMAGSLDAGVPADAKPEGRVAKYFSDDGRRLVFASKYAFEPGGNTTGDLTVYERDLQAGTTEIVSTDPSANTLTGAGISELDVNGDGSRVVVGKRIAVDAEGNEYVHPYLHLQGGAASVDLAPGTTNGVLYAGMTKDGSRIFFTTVDSLLSADTDSSADLYEAVVDGSGNLDLSLVTTGVSDACDPVANEERPHWNSAGGGANCDAVAISGGGGVSAASGTVWFLSPEQLDGSAGTANEPNLYRADPGQAPTFVVSLEPDNPLVVDSVANAASRRTADFQATADGSFAAFTSKENLGGLENFGFADVYEYNHAADEVGCASCDVSGTTDHSLLADSFMPPAGQALLEDGRVFFTTRTPLVLNDANGRDDVYSWAGGSTQLISAGTGPFDSALLTTSSDGTDVFFFTHDTLAPEEDQVGPLMKIYDARAGGGFFKLPPEVPCAAADECHGASSPVPPPPDIKSSGPTTRGNVLSCAKGKVKRHGKCVKKHKGKAKKHRHHGQGKKQGKGRRHA
jgi:hypothetical protein